MSKAAIKRARSRLQTFRANIFRAKIFRLAFRLRLSRALVLARMALGLGLQSCQSQTVATGFLSQIDGVYSGQSLSVVTPLPISSAEPVYRVRLAGLDAPDREQLPWGAAAKTAIWDWVNQTCANNTLTINFPEDAEVDRYSRVWAYVSCGDQLLNEHLVFYGHAIARRDGLRPEDLPYQTQLNRAQELARLAGLGIWNPAQPMRQTPGEFRQQAAAQSST